MLHSNQGNWHLLLLLGTCCSLYGLVSSSGYMTIQFQQYYNADGRCADGTFCDTVMFFDWKESNCDPQFRLTADKLNPGGAGLFDYQQGNYYNNEDVVNFGGRFGEIANPVVINMLYNDNPGTMHIAVNVVDKDTSVNDHMDTFSTALQANGPHHRALNLYSLPMNNRLTLTYWYTCHTNYYGSLCNTYCLARDDHANGHYTCDGNGQKVCLAGWIGPDTGCKTPHPCNAGVCQNGAACSPSGESYTCHCPADYSGVTCQQFLDPCVHRNPCLNGAQCFLDAAKQPQCRCPPEFTGARCDQDVNECASTDAYPCQNGMPCRNTHGGFECNCTDPHFAGRLCQEHVCHGVVCHNNGTCNPSFDRGPTCACMAGFVGDACETNVDDCAGKPCQNGAVCRDLVANFTCDCTDGFDGRLCETNVDDCAGSPCQNGATCRDLVANFSCDCTDGFEGHVCQTNVDDCADRPCQNGAVCRDLVANFTCVCPHGFDGRLCETNVDDCAGNPCQNGGTCTDGIAGFNCTCRPGYDGRACELSTTTTPWPRVGPGLMVGGTPGGAAASGESVSVAAVAAGSAVGFLLLVGIGAFLGVWMLRNRIPAEHIPDDASSSAFSNAVYNNAGEVSGSGTNTAASHAAASIVVVDDEGNSIYEDLGSDRVNQAYEVDA